MEGEKNMTQNINGSEIFSRLIHNSRKFYLKLLSLGIAAMSTLVIVNSLSDFYFYAQFSLLFYISIYFSIFGIITSLVTLIGCLRK